MLFKSHGEPFQSSPVTVINKIIGNINNISNNITGLYYQSNNINGFVLSKFVFAFGAQSKCGTQLQLETREFQRIFIDIQQNPIKSEEMRRAAATNFYFDFITLVHFYFCFSLIRGSREMY